MLAAQLNAYVNRFGPGAVVYWFDFVDTLADASPNVLLLRSVPTDFITLAGEHITLTAPITEEV